MAKPRYKGPTPETPRPLETGTIVSAVLSSDGRVTLGIQGNRGLTYDTVDVPNTGGFALHYLRGKMVRIERRGDTVAVQLLQPSSR